jgi:hypothetical protein
LEVGLENQLLNPDDALLVAFESDFCALRKRPTAWEVAAML